MNGLPASNINAVTNFLFPFLRTPLSLLGQKSLSFTVCLTLQKQLLEKVASGIDLFDQQNGLKIIGMNKIDLSIVIVNYKSWKLLEKCFSSFEKFSPKLSYELIVVDNASDDGHFSKFKKNYDYVKFYANEGNYGFSSGCNLGAKHANGEFILFLNPDTELNQSHAIDTMFKFLKEHNNVGVVSCRTIMPNRIGGEISFFSPWLLIGWIRSFYKFLNKKKLKVRFNDSEDIWYPDWVGGSVMMFNRQIFNEIKGFDEDTFWMYYEDPDICIKLKKIEKKSAIIRNVSINHIGGGASKIDNNSTLMLKTEMIISAHNYILKNSKNIDKTIIFPLFILKSTIPRVIKTLVYLPLYRSANFKKNLILLRNILLYYLSSFKRKTWKSTKIKQ